MCACVYTRPFPSFSSASCSLTGIQAWFRNLACVCVCVRVCVYPSIPLLFICILQLDGIQAWFRNLESWHVSTMVALEVLPLTLLLLPATQGALLGGLDLVSRVGNE